jgi:hypothetical protein
MDPQVQQSFIPKKPLVGESRSGINGLFTFAAGLLFFASLLAAGGAWFYGQHLDSSIADKKTDLDKAKAAFNLDKIQELGRLDSRFIEAQKLLDSHIAVTGLFSFLADSTLEKVQFTSLSLDVDKGGTAKLSMSGVADSFSTLALQSDKFSEAKMLRDVIFSGITTDATGHVVFSVSANVDPALMSYARLNAAVQGTEPGVQN